jgi:hypothetical protein
MFDRILSRKVGRKGDLIDENMVTGPLRGFGLALVMEIREKYYQMKER